MSTKKMKINTSLPRVLLKVKPESYYFRRGIKVYKICFSENYVPIAHFYDQDELCLSYIPGPKEA